MKLVVLKNNQQIAEIFVEIQNDIEVIFVGRSEDCHVRISDPLLSRHHFSLTVSKDEILVKKITPIGDVYISGESIQLKSIQSGDRVNFNSYSMIVEHVFKPAFNKVPPESTLNISDTVIEELERMDLTSHKPIQEVNEEATVMTVANDSSEVLDQEEYSAVDEVEEPASQLDDDFLGHDDDNQGSPVFETENQSTSDEESFTSEASDFSNDLSHNEDMSLVQGQDSNSDSDKTIVFNTFARYELVLFGEFAPYDKYLIEGQDIFIGRDTKKCQIILNDPEVSSVHAVVRKNNAVIVVEDLNSSNGTIFKGQRINKEELKNNDEFLIGSTTFTLKVKSDLLETEQDHLMPVDMNQVIEKEEIIEEEVDIGELDLASGETSYNDSGAQEKSALKKLWKDPKKRKILIYSLVGLGLLYVLTMDDSPSENKDKPAKPTEEKVAEAKETPKEAAPDNVKNLSDEEKRNLEAMFKWAESLVAQGKLDDAMAELEKIMIIDENFNNVKTLYAFIKQKQEELKKKEEERAELARREKIREEVKALEIDAERAVKDRNVKLAEELFSQIIQKDPENIRAQTLKIELDGWLQEEARKESERAKKEADRKRMVDALNPGKNSYLKKEWFKAITELDKFLEEKGMDEDLVKEASEMLGDAKNNLNAEIAPILGKARSLKEGQDLKSAYETFQEILKFDPLNAEAIYEMDQIRESLDTKARKIYREAIISESLSLFIDAKEKFIEVQQNSPTDSEYYKKATEKLKNYLE